MTTVRLRFRKSSVCGRPGTLFYQLSRRQECRRINTAMHIAPEMWDPVSGRIRVEADSSGKLAVYQRMVDRDLNSLDRIVAQLDVEMTDYSLEDVARKFVQAGDAVSSLQYIEREIASLENERRYGTARNRRRALSSFSAFAGGRDIPFAWWSSRLMTEYSSWLRRRNVARNTVSFYMRILRSVYNKAVKEGLVSQAYPFSDVYTGVDRTRKRAVDEDVLLRLTRLDLGGSRALELARDMFLFSYGARGMSFVDMVFLRHSDICGDIMFYVRRKTGQRLCVRIEPCVRHIIGKYRSDVSPYVFPVIKSSYEDEAYRQYQTALGYYNRKLKRLGRMLGLETPLSSYVARHTWATAARDRNIPIAVISSGMGHTSEKTTRIYLASLDNSIIDTANSRLLAPLNEIFL